MSKLTNSSIFPFFFFSDLLYHHHFGGGIKNALTLARPKKRRRLTQRMILGVGTTCQPYIPKLYMLFPRTPSPLPLISPARRSISHPDSNEKNPRRRHAAEEKGFSEGSEGAGGAGEAAHAPNEKPATMSQEAWDEEKRRCTMVTADYRRHH
jgi:hypothetical protein